MRVAFVLRSAEVQLLFRRFVRDLSSVIRHQTCLVNSPPPPNTTNIQPPNPQLQQHKNQTPQTQGLLFLIRGVVVVCTTSKRRQRHRNYMSWSPLYLLPDFILRVPSGEGDRTLCFFSKSKLDTSLDRGKSHTKKTSDQDPSWCQVLYEELLCSSAVRFCLAHTVLLWIKC